MAGNEDAVRVWAAVQGQVRVGMDGTVIDLDHNAVWKYIEKAGVEDEMGTFERVMGLFRHFQEKDKDKADGGVDDYMKERDKLT